jgi:hypothetical protein
MQIAAGDVRLIIRQLKPPKLEIYAGIKDLFTRDGRNLADFEQ